MRAWVYVYVFVHAYMNMVVINSFFKGQVNTRKKCQASMLEVLVCFLFPYDMLKEKELEGEGEEKETEEKNQVSSV